MTPNVSTAVLLYPERAADYKWFDVGQLPSNVNFSHEQVVEMVSQPIPFDRFGLAGLDADNWMFGILVSKGPKDTEYEEALCIETALIEPTTRTQAPQPAFWLRPNMSNIDGLEISFVNHKDMEKESAIESTKVSAFVVSVFLEMIHKPNAQYQVYTATPKTNNAKRIRQGKKPLFDWHTVLIEPPRQKMPDQGGTHATPRLHDVRGHWVNRNGKRYWRKAHQRGDASLGVVFHDYKLKEKQDGLGR